VPDSKPRRASRRRSAVMYASAVGIAAAALSAALTALPSTAGVTAGSPIPASAIPRLSSSAWRLATLSHDARPASITAVSVNYAPALQDATPGDYVPSSLRSPRRLVYLVVLVGKFTLNAPVPRGAHLPTGRYLAVTVDPVTFRIMDLGLSNHAPPVPLGHYGPVSNLMKQR
jgi:hypothetical protein